MDYFKDKIAVVTGGSSGIGHALTRALGQAGSRVVILSRDVGRAEQIAASLREEGLSVEGRSADVRDRAAVDDAIRDVVESHGRIDLLFNCAGITIFGEARDHTADDWDSLIDTNLRGVVHGISAAYPRMIRQRSGHIVNISSLAGLVPTPGAVAYTMSKCGVVGLSEALRLEAREHGVRVSVACPAAVETPIVENAIYRGIDRVRFLAAVPGTRQRPDACAREILRGVARNDAVIANGFAAMLWRVWRYCPFIVRFLGGKLARKIGEIRQRSNQDAG